ncbi:MAG: FUSC family protein [Clostridia bacterium]|nr:FUSC family protein [Clostridia bacterium]
MLKKFFKIGMRTTKTTLCVFVCLVVYEIFSYISKQVLPQGFVYDILRFAVFDGSPSFACIAAVICMQDNIEGTKKVAVSRIIGSLVGGGFAMLFTFLNNLIFSGRLYIAFALIGVILIICICNYLENPISVSISVITFLIIFIGTDVIHPYYFSINRIIGTLIGALSSFLINKYIYPPEE